MANGHKPNHVGSALVPNTLVCEVSRLFPGALTPGYAMHHRSSAAELNQRRLLDLFALIDAVCLHEKLYTLPCELTADVESLSFRQVLMSSGILETLDIEGTHSNVSDAIVNSLERAVAGVDQQTDTTFAPRASFTPERFKSFLTIQDADQSRDQDRRRGWGNDRISSSVDVYQLSGGRSGDALKASSFVELAQSLVWSMHYMGSGAYEDCTSILRDMYYICTSEALNLPYWPQLDRIEFSRRFPTFLSKSIRTELYGILAKGLQESVEQVEEEFECGATFVPPFAALALSRSDDAQALCRNVLAVRDEYASLRRQLGELEAERLEANSLKERRRIISRHKHLLAEAAKAFERPRVITLESVIRYLPQVTKAAASPADPTKYGDKLLLQPIEWLTTWLRRRPVSKLLQLGDRVHDLESYEGLVAKVFGRGILGT
jgi:hypothetical protein